MTIRPLRRWYHTWLYHADLVNFIYSPSHHWTSTAQGFFQSGSRYRAAAHTLPAKSKNTFGPVGTSKGERFRGQETNNKQLTCIYGVGRVNYVGSTIQCNVIILPCKIRSKFVHRKLSVHRAFYWYHIYPTPPQDMTQGQFLSGV